MKNVCSRQSHRATLNPLARAIFCALSFAGLLVTSPESMARSDLAGGQNSAQPVRGFPAAQAKRKFVPGQIIVQPLPGLSMDKLGKMVGAFGGRSDKYLDRINVHVIKVPEGREDELAEQLSRNPHIAFAGKDELVEHAAIPNDPYYSDQWHLPKIQGPLAWDSISGNQTVTVAVLDTGVDDTHPDLAGKLVPGWNVASNSADTSPIALHGTWVAGVVAASNNNGLGVASVGGNNTLVQPVRVTDNTSGSASWSNLANGLIWAADHGAKVANISYDMGYYCGHTTLDSAAQYFRSKGGVVVTAAGNSGTQTTCQPDPYLIIVSATDSNDLKASFSSYGDFIDVAAPGKNIYTTSYQTSSSGVSYDPYMVSGTSFSSPVTAGVVALMMEANPGLTPDQYENLLKQSADNIGGTLINGTLPSLEFGWGRVNAANAVLSASQFVPPDTAPPETTVVSPASGSTVSGNQVVSVNAQDNVAVAKVEFYANNQLVGESTVGPNYQFSWDTTAMADGDVPVHSYAYDGAGNRGVSQVNTVKVKNQSFIDTTPPTTSVMSPASGSTVSGTQVVSISAQDNVDVVRVELYANGQLVGQSTTGPGYQISWNTTQLADGNAQLISRAYDSAGNQGQSQAVSVTVNNTPDDTTPPTVAITSPANNARVSGTVTIKVSASDNVGIKQVQLQIDGSVVSTSNKSPLSYSWSTKRVSSGYHTLKAIATDTSNLTSQTSISVKK